jgi:hypothetical protein
MSFLSIDLENMVDFKAQWVVVAAVNTVNHTDTAIEMVGINVIRKGLW